MAIDVLKVLPRVGDMPTPSGRQSQLGERIILEMLQRESNMAQTEQRYALEDYGNAVKAMAGDDFFAETPYQQKLLANVEAKKAGFAKQLQEAGKDSNKINTVMLNYDLFKKTDPDMRNYIQEKTALTSFNKQIENLRDKIDPVAFEGLYKHINDTSRSTPLSMADLNPGALAYDVDKVADDYLKSLTKKSSVYQDRIVGGVGKKVRVETEEIPDNAEQMMTEFLMNHPGTNYYGTDIVKQIAKRKVDAIKYANYEKDKQGKLVPVSRESEFGVYDPTPGSQAAAKATYEDKLKEKIDGDGIEGVLDDGIGTPVIVKNDGVYDKKTGTQYGKIEAKWDDMSEELKSTLRKGGYDYDKYEVAGTGKRISGNFNVEMSRSGLAPDDAIYSEKIGASSKAVVKDGYVETNNPKVLEKMGYTLSYNDKVGRYQLTDSAGKVYDETGSDAENKTRSNTGIFATNGKASGDNSWFWENVSGDEKMFKVKVTPLTGNTPTTGSVGSNGIGDKPFRNNNPFSLNRGDDKYATLQEGYDAGVKDTEDKINGKSTAMMQSKYMEKKYGKSSLSRYGEFATVEDLINVRSPKSDNNDTDAMVARMESIGIPKNTKLKDLTPTQKEALNRKLVKEESPGSYRKLFGADSLGNKTNSGHKIEIKRSVEKEIEYLTDRSKDFIKDINGDVVITSVAHHRRGDALTDKFDMRFNNNFIENIDKNLEVLKKHGYEIHEEYNNRKEYEERIKEVNKYNKNNDQDIKKDFNDLSGDGYYMITYNPKATALHFHVQKYDSENFNESEDEGGDYSEEEVKESPKVEEKVDVLKDSINPSTGYKIATKKGEAGNKINYK